MATMPDDGPMEDRLRVLRRAIFERHALDHAIWGHVSDGNLHPNALPRSRKDMDNARAAQLECDLRQVEGVEILAPTQANAVFAELPVSVAEGLPQRGWQYYSFIGSGGARFMCSWDTSEEDVAALVRDVRELASKTR